MSTSVLETPPPDFLRRLLDEQSQLTAVERFSAAHDVSAEVVPGSRESKNRSSHNPAQAKYYTALLPASPPEPGQQYAFEVDLNACSGCKACVVACHTLNGLDEDESWRRVGTLTIGEEAPRIQHVTTACHHCVDPGCLNGCPVKAYDKDPLTGIVRHLDDQCIGCKYCTMMCPYEVPTYNSRLGIVRKCDMCQQRLSVGEAPACVQACPNAAIAIRVISVGDVQFSAGDRLSPGAPLSSITRPTTRYFGRSTKKFSQSKAQDSVVDHPAESHWPLAIMLVATQAAIGLLLIERLAFYSHAWLSHNFSHVGLTLPASCLALVVAALGLAVAGLHLGQPWRAWRIFLGLRTSWLSREGVLFGNTLGLLGLSIGVHTVLDNHTALVPAFVREFASAGLAEWLAGLTVTMGVLSLLSSGMIYIATQRQLWRAQRTLTRFLGSALCLGCVGWGMVLSRFTHEITQTAFFLTLGGLAIGLKLLWEWKLLLGNVRSSDAVLDRRSRRLALGPLAGLSKLRLICGCLACSLAMLAAASAFSSASSLTFGMAILAGAAMLGGELCERLLYFSTVVHDRMPGTLP